MGEVGEAFIVTSLGRVSGVTGSCGMDMSYERERLEVVSNILSVSCVSDDLFTLSKDYYRDRSRWA